jgi:glucokinase
LLVSGGGDRPPAFDLNYLWGYQMVKPLSKIAQAEEPDETSMKFYLVGDIGGTNSRLALYEASDEADSPTSSKSKESIHAKTYLNEKFESFNEIVKLFLEEFGALGRVTSCCLAVAGPIEKNRVVMTNRDFVIDGHQISEAMDIPRVELINDFLANGYGCLCLGPSDICTIQEGMPVGGAVKALIGAGTGLGVGCLTPSASGEYNAFPSEGGHCDFGPRNELEFDLLQFLKHNYNRHRISYERIVSGRGIYEVYEFFAQREPKKVLKEVTKAIAAAEDQQAGVVAKYQDKCELCRKAMDLFISVYGSAAGNIALTYLPRGGLYVCGGIAVKNLEKMKAGPFIQALNDKGRIGPMIAKIPVHIVLCADDLGRRGALLVARRIARKPFKQLRASRFLSEDEKETVQRMIGKYPQGPYEDSDEEEYAKADAKPPAVPVRSPDPCRLPLKVNGYTGGVPASPAVVFRRGTGTAPFIPSVPASPMILSRGIAPTPRTFGPIVPSFAYPPVPATSRAISALRSSSSFVLR